LIAIVGGGITGLALAHHLARLGVPHRVLEAGNRPGGVIRSAEVEGRVLDWGPQRTRLTGPIGELVDDLGLRGQVVTAPADLPLFVYAAGKLRAAPFSAGAFWRSDLLSPSAKLRVLLEPLTAAPRADESVADLFRRKVGGQAYERLVGPLYGGLYASDPAEMVVGSSLARALREFGIGRSLLAPLVRRGFRIDPPPAVSFRHGMATLPLALAARHADTIRLSTSVRALVRSGDGWRLEMDGETLDADTVVLTVPAREAARLLGDAAPDAAERIATLRYNPLAVVHLVADGVPRGLGFQVALGEEMRTRGVTFNHWLFGRDGVCTAYLGGARWPEVERTPEDELAKIAVDELRRAAGAEARVLAVARERMPAWDRSWAALEGVRPPPGIVLAANWESRPGLPGRLAQTRRLAETLARR
jgi:protoporphyrinogen/coproporphyrinogen III oxidase